MNTLKNKHDNVRELAELILKHKRLYYQGVPEISDYEYDRYEERLRAIAPGHPLLNLVGTPDNKAPSQKLPHIVPMLSLNKTYDRKELIRWANGKALNGMYKIDGNSLSLTYTNGRLTQAKTRGDGYYGEDILDKVRWISECIPSLFTESTPFPQDLEVRGEVYCNDMNFSGICNDMEQLRLERPSSPRNIVAGVMGRKQFPELARYFSFFAFDVLIHNGELSFSSEREKLAWLQNQGFPLPPGRFLEHTEDIDVFLEEVRMFMEDGNYGIDGAVFTFDDPELHRSLGSTAHHPRYRLSFKWQGDTAKTTIETIIWATSRLGIVTPVARTEAVQLSNASISNVTLHNAAYVRNFRLKPGDQIEIVRSGEVIPKFLRVIRQVDGDPQLPSACPSCGTSLTDDGIRLSCPARQACPSQLSGFILNWIRWAGIDDLSEKRLNQLIELGLIQHPADLYTLTKEDFLKLPLTREKMAEKLLKNIRQSQQISLSRFLCGLGIRGMGPAMWDLLLEHIPGGLDSIRNASSATVAAIRGFAEKSAELVVSGLKELSPDIDRLLEAGIQPQTATAPASHQASQIFFGQQFVLTGTMSRPRHDLAALIQEHGGKVSSSVSKKTRALIIADPSSGSEKARKARELGIELWSEDELIRQMEQG